MPVISRLQTVNISEMKFYKNYLTSDSTNKDCTSCNVCTNLQGWTQLVDGLVNFKIRNLLITLWNDFSLQTFTFFLDFLNGVANYRKFCRFRKCRWGFPSYPWISFVNFINGVANFLKFRCFRVVNAFNPGHYSTFVTRSKWQKKIHELD